MELNTQPEVKTFRVEHAYVEFYVNALSRLGWQMQNISEGISDIKVSAYTDTSSMQTNNSSSFAYPYFGQVNTHGFGITSGSQNTQGDSKVSTLMTLIFTRPRDMMNTPELRSLSSDAVKLVDKYIQSCRIGKRDQSIWNECNQKIEKVEAAIKEDLKEYNLGLLEFKAKNYDKAVEYYDKAIAINPNNHLFWHDKGNALRWNKKYKESIMAYDKALEINPEYIWSLSCKSYALLELLNNEEALAPINRALEIKPQNTSLWFTKGYILNRLGKVPEAIMAFENSVKYDNKNTDSLTKLLDLYEKNSYSEKALATVEQLLTLNPQDTKYILRKANFLKELRSYKKAILCLNEALKINPDDKDIKQALQDCLAKQKADPYAEKPKFIKFAHQLLSKKQDNIDTSGIIDKPKILEQEESPKQKSEEVKTSLEKETKETPSKTTPPVIIKSKDYSPSVKKAMLDSAHKFLDFQAKENDLSKDIRKQAKELFNEGSKLSRKLKFKESIEAYEKAIELNPYQTIYQISLNYSYKELKEYDKALKGINRLLKVDNQNLNWLEDKAEILCYMKRFNEADDILKEVEASSNYEKSSKSYFKSMLKSYKKRAEIL